MQVKRSSVLVFSVVAMAAVAVAACGDDVGVCVSEPVQYSYGQRVYCYENWDKADCDNNNDNQVNGASWTFHGGQDCSDRDLTTGSNPWP